MTNPTETRSAVTPLKPDARLVSSHSADAHNVSVVTWLTQLNLERGVRAAARGKKCCDCSLKK